MLDIDSFGKLGNILGVAIGISTIYHLIHSHILSMIKHQIAEEIKSGQLLNLNKMKNIVQSIGDMVEILNQHSLDIKDLIEKTNIMSQNNANKCIMDDKIAFLHKMSKELKDMPDIIENKNSKTPELIKRENE